MEYLGLLFELLLLAAGVYIYLFSRGIIKSKDPEIQKRADTLRSKNGWLLRAGGLALTAIMTMNVVLHLIELFGG